MRTLENILFFLLFISLLIIIGYKLAEIKQNDKDITERYRKIDSLQRAYKENIQIIESSILQRHTQNMQIIDTLNKVIHTYENINKSK